MGQTTAANNKTDPQRPLSLQEVTAQNFNLQLWEAYLGFSGVLSEIAGADDSYYTVFAPWDEAFETLEESLTAKLQNPAWVLHLQNLLRYHIFQGDLPLSQVQETQTLTMSNGENVVMERQAGTAARIRANNVLVLATYDAANGFAYMLDEVLKPAWLQQTLLRIVLTPFPTFTSLVVTIGYEAILVDSTASLTVFAPNDVAFAKLGQARLDYLKSEDGKSTLIAIVSYHLIAGGPFPSMLATQLPGGIQLIDGDPIIVSGQFNHAFIVQADLLANNGLVHEIDTVLAIEPVTGPNVTLPPNTESPVSLSPTLSPTTSTPLAELLLTFYVMLFQKTVEISSEAILRNTLPISGF